MLRVELTERDGATEIVPFERAELTIGRVSGCDLVLPGATVSKRHARVVVRDARLIVVDLKSTNGTRINGRRLTAPYVLGEADRVGIGDFTLRIFLDSDPYARAPTLEIDPTEQRLLAATLAGELGSREVYADWLEERGEAARAEYLRLQDAIAELPPGTRAHPARARARVLAAQVEARWRLKISRPVIEGCADGGCPRDWGALRRTHPPEVRECPTCSRRVHFHRDAFEVQRHVQAGGRAVLDPAAGRWQGDAELERAPTAEVLPE